MRTALKELLGIEIPILLAPMAGGPASPALAAAVAEAGGLGGLGVTYLDGGAIRAEAAALRALTKGPFALNLFIPEPASAAPTEDEIEAARSALAVYRARYGLPAPDVAEFRMPDFDEQLAAVLEIRPRAFSFTTGAPPEDAMAALREAGIAAIGTATTVREARILMTAGVQAIIAQGSEAGGHRGSFNYGAGDDPADTLIGTLALVRQIVRAVDVPVIAAGGIMDGHGIAAALALGAAGVQMGSAFLACPEAGTGAAYRAALAEAGDDATVLTRLFSGRRARVLRSRFVTDMEQSGAAMLPYPLQIGLTRPLRDAALAQGSGEFSPFFAGQAIALHRAMPAGELIRTLIREYADARRSLPSIEGD